MSNDQVRDALAKARRFVWAQAPRIGENSEITNLIETIDAALALPPAHGVTDAVHQQWEYIWQHIITPSDLNEIGKRGWQLCYGYDSRNASGLETQYCFFKRPALEAAALASSPQGWRTMDSAPKDGSNILIAGGTILFDGSTYDDWLECKGIYTAWWFTRYDGGWCSGNAEGHDEFIWHKPTHWQPLPPPPPERKMP